MDWMRSADIKRHMYHTDGMTDLSKLRRDAAIASGREQVMLHVHPHTEAPCGFDKDEHELYEQGVRVDG